MAKPHSDPISLFWSKVQKSETGCWLWTAAVDKDGYGKFQITLPRGDLPTGAPSKQRHVRAHVYSYELHHGPLPDGKLVMHSCDTPGCVRPDHLQAGTQVENRADCASKGRAAKGVRCPSAKLDDERAAQIRTRSFDGESAEKLAVEYEVSVATVYSIAAGKSWKHVSTAKRLNI